MKIRNLFIAILLAAPAAAAVPNRITYQGRLMKSGLSSVGDHRFIACFVGSGGPICNPQQTLTLPITGDFTLTVEVPAGVDFFNNSYQLRLTVDGTDLSPNDDFTAVPYALVAASATSVNADNVHLQNTPQNLATWQSQNNPDRIDPGKIEGVSLNAGAGLVPQGAILMFDDRKACPAGFSEVQLLRNRFPIGADLTGTDPDVPDDVGITTGTKFPSHAHTHSGTTDITAISLNHSHTITIATAGTHNHGGLTGGNGAQGQGNDGANAAAINHYHSISTDGAHTHNGTVGTTNLDASHSHPFTTGPMAGTVGAHIPPALTVLFCTKD
jgi:hypothetical protein